MIAHQTGCGGSSMTEGNRLFSGLDQKEVVLSLVTRASVGLQGRRVLNVKRVDVQFACSPEECSRRAPNDGVGGAVSRNRFVAHAGGRERITCTGSRFPH